MQVSIRLLAAALLAGISALSCTTECQGLPRYMSDKCAFKNSNTFYPDSSGFMAGNLQRTNSVIGGVVVQSTGDSARPTEHLVRVVNDKRFMVWSDSAVTFSALDGEGALQVQDCSSQGASWAATPRFSSFGSSGFKFSPEFDTSTGLYVPAAVHYCTASGFSSVRCGVYNIAQDGTFDATVLTTQAPSLSPTQSPTTPNPTSAPTTLSPTHAPTTSSPSTAPSKAPTSAPTTSSPSTAPTTLSPSISSSQLPTSAPNVSDSIGAAPSNFASLCTVSFLFLLPFYL